MTWVIGPVTLDDPSTAYPTRIRISITRALTAEVSAGKFPIYFELGKSGDILRLELLFTEDAGMTKLK